MINSIVDAISVALNSAFGDGYEVYTDDVEQGLKEPCFLISVLNFRSKPMLGGRSFRANHFVVQYVPKTQGDNGELLRVGEQMVNALDMIAMHNGDFIRGTNMEYRIEGGALHFFVQFNMYLIKRLDTVTMETMDVTTNTKRS